MGFPSIGIPNNSGYIEHAHDEFIEELKRHENVVEITENDTTIFITLKQTAMSKYKVLLKDCKRELEYYFINFSFKDDENINENLSDIIFFSNAILNYSPTERWYKKYNY